MKAAAAKLGAERPITIALNTTKKLGYPGTHEQAVESYEPATEKALAATNLCFLVILAISAASFLDPLESITRYPGQNREPFTKEDVYVERFQALHQIIETTLSKAKKSHTDRVKLSHEDWAEKLAIQGDSDW